MVFVKDIPLVMHSIILLKTLNLCWGIKQHALGVFINQSKAFDTIDHSKLITQLNKHGIRSNTFNLISSYLTNRKQYVSVLDFKYNELPVKFGTPQGISVLGLLLFILYINDICKFTDNGKFVRISQTTSPSADHSFWAELVTATLQYSNWLCGWITVCAIDTIRLGR
jgi:hypothetical protein